MSKRLSPFSREFWVKKGYSEEEAEIKRNSLRPIRKEYWMERGFSEKESDKIFEVLGTGKSYGYRLYTEKGLLRSALEIEFYKLCISHKINFLLDKNYPNSNFRYDFYLPEKNLYIEISPNYNKKGNEKYTEKINKKKKIFNCLIIKNIQEIESFFEEIINKWK